MKQNKKLALLLAASMTLSLALTGCGGSTPSSSEPSEPGKAESGDFSYLADFSYSGLFDENGYVKGVTATDFVTLPDNFNALVLPAGTDVVTDEALESAIKEQVLSYFGTTEEVTDRAAEIGDTVNIDFVGSVDGVEFDGGNSQGAGYQITLGTHSFIDDFEDQIAGHMPGETFDVHATFPDDYGAEGTERAEMNGKEALFVTTLNYIYEDVLPEFTDEFVQENLADEGWDTAEEVREYYRELLLDSQMVNAVYDELETNVSYADELPKNVRTFFSDFALYSLYSYFGNEMGSLLTQYGYESADQYLEDMEDAIVSNSRSVLLIQALAEKLGIVCTEADLAANANDVFGTEDYSDLEEYYGQGYLKMATLEYLVLQQLKTTATVEPLTAQ